MLLQRRDARRAAPQATGEGRSGAARGRLGRLREGNASLPTAAAGLACVVLLHLVLFRSSPWGRVDRSLACQPGSAAAHLDNGYLEGLAQLRYDEAVLQAQRDRLLALPFATPGTRAAPAALAAAGSTSVKGLAAAGNVTDGVSPASLTERKQLFLFAAVFSTVGFRDRRDSVREAWLTDAARLPGVAAAFIMSTAEASEDAQAEAAQQGDIIFTTDQHTGYRSIIHKTYFTLEYATRLYDVRFILKTDDDAFVNVQALITELKGLCHNPGCQHERIYLGKEIRNNVVRVTKGDRWFDEEYLNHTSLRTYMPYMMGGGYVLSGDLAAVILGINQQSRDANLLKFMPNEDVSIGFWLMSVDLRRIDHPRVITWSHPCCFERATRAPASPVENRAWFRTTVDVCAQPAWLILHKIQYTREMLYLGHRLRQCPQVHALTDRARALAVAARDTALPLIAHGKVWRLTPGGSGPSGQFALGCEACLSPWSANRRLVAVLKLPAPADAGAEEAGGAPGRSAGKVELGVLRLVSGAARWQWEHLDTSAAWGPHQGPHLQWLGATSRYLVFNDRRCPGAAAAASGIAACYTTAVVYDLQQMTRARTLARPVAALSPDGSAALSLSFRRLEVAAPGYGYPDGAAALDAEARRRCPENDGLWLLNMYSGASRLVVSLAQLAAAVAPGGPSGRTADPLSGVQYGSADGARLPDPATCFHWISHAQFNREGEAAVFQYHVGLCDASAGSSSANGQGTDEQALGSAAGAQRTYLFTISLSEDGSTAIPASLWRVPMVAGTVHFDYGRAGRLLVCDESGRYEATNRRDVVRLEPPTPVAQGVAGDCRYFLDNERFLLGTSLLPPAARRRLWVWDRWLGSAHVVGEYAAQDEVKRSPAAYAPDGLRPLWSRDGKYAAFASAHAGQGWQVYAAGVHDLGVAMTPAASKLAPGGRPVFVDVGAGRGSASRAWLRRMSKASAAVAHAFEPHPGHLPALQALARRSEMMDRLLVHPVAAWTSKKQVTLAVESAPVNGDYRIGPVQRSLRFRVGEWLRARLYGLPGSTQGSMFTLPTSPAAEARVPAIDFSSWLAQTVRAADEVTLRLDCAGCEFDLLARMVNDGSILLVDKMEVKWNDVFRQVYAEWPLLYEEVFDMLGLDFVSASGEERKRP